jgi:hypothetical protein
VESPTTAVVASAAGAVVAKGAPPPLMAAVVSEVTWPLSLIESTGTKVELPTSDCAVVIAASEIVPLSVIVPPASPSPAVMLVTVPVPAPPPSPD